MSTVWRVAQCEVVWRSSNILKSDGGKGRGRVEAMGMHRKFAGETSRPIVALVESSVT